MLCWRRTSMHGESRGLGKFQKHPLSLSQHTLCLCPRLGPLKGRTSAQRVVTTWFSLGPRRPLPAAL